ncbi:MAG: ribosome-associated translation inhibitor RaiA [Chloroflexota bacterium]
MELVITGKHLDITPEVRSYVERKLGKLSRHLPGIMKANVEVAEEKTRSREHHFVAQVTLDAGGAILRGEVRGEDLLTAIDRVEKVMVRQIDRYKGKTQSRGRDSIRGESSAETAIPQPSVIKTKRFFLKALSEEQAVERMELLGHDFFLFLDENSEVNLLYRRRDGNYGLIGTTTRETR